MPPDPDAAGSGSKNQAGSPGTSIVGQGVSAGGSGTSVVTPDLGTASPGSGTAIVGLETTPTQQAAADSGISPPSPPALVAVAVLAIEEVAAPSWAQSILNFLINQDLPADEVEAR